jgi:hypothetical protein
MGAIELNFPFQGLLYFTYESHEVKLPSNDTIQWFVLVFTKTREGSLDQPGSYIRSFSWQVLPWFKKICSPRASWMMDFQPNSRLPVGADLQRAAALAVASAGLDTVNWGLQPTNQKKTKKQHQHHHNKKNRRSNHTTSNTPWPRTNKCYEKAYQKHIITRSKKYTACFFFFCKLWDIASYILSSN